MNEEFFGLIYKITNLINNKIYIGQTVRSLQDRFRGHINQAESNKKSKDKMVLCRAIQKYGKDNFIIEEIDKASSQEELNDLEIYYICKYDSLAKNGKGYNIAKGGLCGNLRLGLSEEEYALWREKLSKAHRDRVLVNDGASYKAVPKDEVEKYKSLGYKVGKSPLSLESIKKFKESNGQKHKNMTWVNNGLENKMIYKQDIELFLKKGYQLGRLYNKTWVNNNEKESQVPLNELNIYLSNGYKQGRLPSPAKGCLIIHKEEVIKTIQKEELDFYLSHGWEKGGLKRVGIYKNSVQKFILFRELESYLKEGWARGGVKKK